MKKAGMSRPSHHAGAAYAFFIGQVLTPMSE